MSRGADAGNPAFSAGIARQKHGTFRQHDVVHCHHNAGDRRRDDQRLFGGCRHAGQRQTLVDHFADTRQSDRGDRSPAESRQHRTYARRSVDLHPHPGFIPKQRRGVRFGGQCFAVRRRSLALAGRHLVRAQHPLHGPGDLLGRERLGHVVAGPQPHRRRGIGNAGIARNDQHRNVGLLLSQLFQELDPVDIGHLDVQQNDRVILLGCPRKTLPGIRVHLDLESLSRKNPPTGLAHDFLVVDHQQSAIVRHGLLLMQRFDQAVRGSHLAFPSPAHRSPGTGAGPLQSPYRFLTLSLRHMLANTRCTPQPVLNRFTKVVYVSRCAPRCLCSVGPDSLLATE